MTQRLDRVIRAACAMPWAIQPEKLEAILELLALKGSGKRLTQAQINARIGSGRSKAEPVPGNIAVLPLHGVIAHRMNMMTDISGGTSTEMFGQWFDMAMEDDSVSAIVMDIDSPGGTVQGVQELAARIYAARGRKPIVAVANSTAASAAYWIASAADELVVMPSGLVGSIGVFTVHTDESEADAKEGVKRTLIKAGRFKAEDTPFSPLSDEAREATQEMVDEVYGQFVQAVATYRGEKNADAVIHGYGEGRAVTAKKALALGMADRIATLEDTLSRLGATGGSRNRLRAATESLPLAATLTTGPELTASIELVGQTIASQTTDSASGSVGPILVSTSDAGHRAPTTPAPTGKEQAMSQDTAANGAAFQEQTPIEALADLADLHGMSAELPRWVREKMTVADVTAEIRNAKAKRDSESTLATAAAPVITGGVPNEAKRAFGSLGEQLIAIVEAGSGKASSGTLARLHAAASGASATVGADGGFMIQKDFATDLMSSGFQASELASRCSQHEVSGTSDGLEVVYVDETSRVNGSRWGGVQVYRTAEAETATAKKPKMGKWEVRLEDIMGVAYLTERLAQDAPAMAQVFEEAFQEEFGFVLDDEIFRGTGAGQCLGVKTAGASVSVAKETSQVAATIVAENVLKMYARLLPRSRKNAAWFINVACEPQLAQMSVKVKNVAGDENVGGFGVYMPAGGLSGSPYATLFGLPVIPIEHADALGTKGDISLLDLSQYKLVRKGGVDSAESIHVRFLYNERTLRWTTRVNGAPKLKSSITPYKGSDALSAFVFLDTRS